MDYINKETVNAYNEDNETTLTIEQAEALAIEDAAEAASSLSEQVEELIGNYLYNLTCDDQQKSLGLIDRLDFKELVRKTYAEGLVKVLKDAGKI